MNADDAHGGMSLTEVAKALGISPQRVQQIEQEALRKLRRWIRMSVGEQMRQYYRDLE